MLKVWIRNDLSRFVAQQEGRPRSVRSWKKRPLIRLPRTPLSTTPSSPLPAPLRCGTTIPQQVCGRSCRLLATWNFSLSELSCDPVASVVDQFRIGNTFPQRVTH